ncbi:MAG TPA: phosphoribosyl-ATP diphosphatase [Casimicrobiaceae bacterium]|nr:phosphoribosyl-ATP diphosphatase [Casimicrobiaceae bacterium]
MGDSAPQATATELTKHGDVLRRLTRTIAKRRNADPATSYVATLFAKGDDAMVKKIGEEATEAVMAAMDGDKIRLTAEIADLWFHCLVVLVKNGLGPEDVLAELERREGVSGLQEKAARL